MSRDKISKNKLEHLAKLYNEDHKGIRSKDENFLNGNCELTDIWFDFFKEYDEKTLDKKPFVPYTLPRVGKVNFLDSFGKYIIEGSHLMNVSEEKNLEFFGMTYFVPNFITMMTRIRKGKHAAYRYNLNKLKPNTFVHSGLNVPEGKGDAVISAFQLEAFSACLESRYKKDLSPLKVETEVYKYFPISVGIAPLLEARIDQIVNQLFNEYYSRFDDED